jgi:hypothetical protein
MKTIKSVAVFLMVIAIQNLFGQELTMTVYYLKGEKSKDSHSSEEQFAIAQTTVAYSIKYSGRRGKNQNDSEKFCTFTEQDVKNIVQTVTDKGLNVTDSAYVETSKTKSFEVYTNINIAMMIDGKDYSIKINGDTEQLSDSKLYKNSIFLITLLRKMVKDCE